MFIKTIAIIIAAIILEQLVIYDILNDYFPNWMRISFFASYLILGGAALILIHDSRRKNVFKVLQFITFVIGLALSMAVIHWAVLVS